MLATKNLVPYCSEAILRARQAFFDDGCNRPEMIGDAVLRSWVRCRSMGRDTFEDVEFASIGATELSYLLDRHRVLIEEARPELSSLARSVAGAGYAVMLTDAVGRSLVVDGSISNHGMQLRQSFRVGVDLSEKAVGTSAMSVAMSEGRAMSICGDEHYFANTNILHCCAAPIYGPQGDLIASVDISHDGAGMLDSAVWLIERCAQRIEQRLFQRLPAYLRLEIDIDDIESTGGVSGIFARLAFGRHGELLAASRSARKLLGLSQHIGSIDFQILFSERFDRWLGRLRGSVLGEPLTLSNGIRFRATEMSCDPIVSPNVRSPGASISIKSPDQRSLCFGDKRIDIGFAKAQRALGANLPILITGETGSGKDIAARALHAASVRSKGPMVALNCAAIPGELLAAELFGHVEGAYTGSRRGGAQGKIEAAHGGTLFLDEIGDMPLHLQASFLRVLDAREVVRLGESKGRIVDMRVICATHRNLHKEVEEGRFREDLLYRISGHEFHLIPLRERNDFDAILNTLLTEVGEDRTRVPEDVRRYLRNANWPGNVRQLYHSLRRALALAAPTELLSVDDFSLNHCIPIQPIVAESKPKLMRDAQYQAIENALEKSSGNVANAANLLGIGRSTLYRYIKEGQSKRTADR